MTLAETFAALIADLPTRGLADEIAALGPRIDETSDPALRGEVAKLLGFYWLRRGDNAQALAWSDRAASDRPDDPACAYNAIYACLHLGRWDDTAARCAAALAAWGEQSNIYDILAACHGAAGNAAGAARAGTRALALKDAAARFPPHDLSGVPVPPFDHAAPGRNVIAFSLFGSGAKYTDGAILNARAAPFLYPGWTVRAYIDGSVPAPVVAALGQAGAQVMRVGGMASDPYGPLWRFLVADDPGVDRYLMRDADSLLNVRERLAVDAWLQSARHFHVMRDHYDHSELVLAGMWGGVRGALPPILRTLEAWSAARVEVPGKTLDQEFLRGALWPTIRRSVLAHDSQFAFGDPVPFPPGAAMPPGCWVGCQWRQHAAAPVL